MPLLGSIVNQITVRKNFLTLRRFSGKSSPLFCENHSADSRSFRPSDFFRHLAFVIRHSAWAAVVELHCFA
jgi:hypothetical protein